MALNRTVGPGDRVCIGDVHFYVIGHNGARLTIRMGMHVSYLNEHEPISIGGAHVSGWVCERGHYRLSFSAPQSIKIRVG